MFPGTLMLTTVVPQASTMLVIGPGAVAAALAVGALVVALLLGATRSDGAGYPRAVEPVIPLLPPLAPPDREAA